jgi:hypothetical protein
VAQVIVMSLAVYFGVGIAFAIWFVFAGVNRFDDAAVKAGVGFRLLILPGAAALWPVLMARTRAHQ